MGVSAMKVPTTFTATDKFSHVVERMTSSTKRFSASMSRINHRVNNSFNSLNRFSQLSLGVGSGAIFYKAGNDIMEYEKAVASLGAVTGTTVGSMNKDIQSLGKETGHSVIEITKGFEQVGSKMSEYLSNPTALRAISKQGILMAEASRMSVDDSVDNLTSLLNQFGKGYQSAEMFVNKLSAGEDIGASTIPETIDVLRQFAASARMAGADVTDSIAMVQAVTKTLGKQGVGRNFRNIMVDLNTGKGMDKNKLKALSMVGININKMIDPATTFIDKMKELTKLSGNKQAMGMFFKKTGFEAGATFLREFKVFEDYRQHINDNNTAVEKAAKNNDTLSYTIARLKDSFTNFIVTNDNSNTALNATKSILRLVIRNMGTLINLIAVAVIAFAGLKTYVGISKIVAGAIDIITAATLRWQLASLIALETGGSFIVALLGWPTIIAAGVLALGGLAYAMSMSSEKMKNFKDNNTVHLKIVAGEYESMEQRIARSNERIVANMKKFKLDLDSVKKTGKTIAELREERGYKVYKANESETVKRLVAPSREGVSTGFKSFVKMPRVVSDSDAAFNSIMGEKENLAGKQGLGNANVLKSLIKGGTVTLNINAPAGVVKDYDDTQSTGVKVNLGSTTGQKSYKNGY